jgi:hypothetical protein
MCPSITNPRLNQNEHCINGYFVMAADGQVIMMTNVPTHYQPPGLTKMSTLGMGTLLLGTTVGQIIMKGNVPIRYQPPGIGWDQNGHFSICY